jgi:multidrug efflux pump subunit AcrB
MNDLNTTDNLGVISRIVHKFLTSQLSIILVFFALSVGIASVLITPREEDPQIVIPLADVYVQFPGASAEEVEKLVATPLERLLWQIDGVEYVYSMARRDTAIVTVRFYVGEDKVESLVKLHNKISMHIDQVPPGVTGWVIKPVEIDDVPIVNLTIYSDRYDSHQLRRIGEEILARLASIEDISRTEIVGGRRREIRVELDPERMAGLSVSSMEVYQALRGADASVTAGVFSQLNREFTVSSDAFITSVDEVSRLVVGVHGGRPVYLRDIAGIIDGPEEAHQYSRIGFSNYYAKEKGELKDIFTFPAVTLALAKKKGTNAVDVAKKIIRRVEELKKDAIPHGVKVVVTRNYGETAEQKVDDLLASLVLAIVTVVGLIAFTMGWKEALVVAIAVPITFSLSLFVNYLTGYTNNRVTLFALILSLGLVVDDPITNVDNIQRHILMRKRKPLAATLFAVDEVLPPVIMSTLAIIVSFIPMAFITGMMGPYMGPMAINVPLAVTFSTVSALTIVPWLSYHLLKRLGESGSEAEASEQDITPVWIKNGYRRILDPLLDSRARSIFVLLVVVVMLIASALLAAFRQVPLKMLPFDNKSEFQIVVDMDEGTPLEMTDRTVRAFEAYLREVPEVTHFVSNAGTASPMDFNGMVRHYYLRQGGHVADIRVNLVVKERREQQSHEILLRLRKDLEAIAKTHHANIKLVETPPGPPVLSTVVGEVYGAQDRSYRHLIEAASHLRKVVAEEPFVVDIDDTVETPRVKVDFILDKEKSALHGVDSNTVIQTLRLALSGASPGNVHLPHERQTLRIKLVLPRDKRSGVAELSRLSVKTMDGRMVELGELGSFVEILEDQTIYHKNLERVVYVFGETVGRAPIDAIFGIQARVKADPLPAGTWVDWTGEGEWHITLKVFRDLGIAFGAAMVGIYLLLIIQTGSYAIPFVIMTAIPLTLIGIMPGFWLLNLITGTQIGGFQNLVFFTATGMIGMIALGGIVVRNSIVLIEFINGALDQGLSFKEAILQSGAVRFRPIILTAGTTALGAWPITLDPIFSGLAWALIFGLIASTLFTMLIVPIVYYMLYRKRYEP